MKPSAAIKSAEAVVLACALLVLWMATHRYRGLGGDAELYAVQALARIHSNLTHDLFLEHTSQDTYTVFSLFYARCIALFGLHRAALILTITFKVWFFAAAWALARCLLRNYAAFLAVAFLIVASGAYGAYGVFRYAEDWVTARSPAEALVVTALALYFRGSPSLGLLVAFAALFVHPLMALPGLLLLICLGSSRRTNVIGAAGAIVVTLCIALAAPRYLWITRSFAVMDANWLEVVRERSQFLFLQLWSTADWKLNVRPFMTLALSSLAITDSRVRKLCASAMLVGATGLAVALIAGLIGPVSGLLQGQAWRWVWVTVFVSILLLVPTLLALWRDPTVGPTCAILVVCAWTIPPVDATVCLACALPIWLLRERFNTRAATYMRGIAVAAGVLMAVWVLRTRLALTWSHPEIPPHKPGDNAVARCFRGAGFFRHGIWVPGALVERTSIDSTAGHRFRRPSDGFAGNVAWNIPRDRSRRDARASPGICRLRGAIPPDSNVFVLPAHNAATFAWFTLQRPSYLTVDQSSGVVFSRATALEVRRRSQVLLPLMDPDWRLLSNMTHASGGGERSTRCAP